MIDVPDVSVQLSNTSSTGRYVSVNVEVVVSSQQERVGLFEALRAHAAVRMVL